MDKLNKAVRAVLTIAFALLFLSLILWAVAFIVKGVFSCVTSIG